METNILVAATQYTFSVAFVGMAAGALYFILERGNLAPELRRVATLAAVIAFVACLNYFSMKSMVGMSGNLEELKQFPTELRYVDWLITTPLILSIFPTLLGPGPETAGIMAKLMLADVVMVVTGYVGEVSINAAGGGTMMGWWGYILGDVAWVYIIVILYGAVGRLARDLSVDVQRQINHMRLFVVIGWATYPVGFIIPLLGYGTDYGVLRELVYNFADLANKVGFGVIAVSAAQTLSFELYEEEG